MSALIHQFWAFVYIYSMHLQLYIHSKQGWLKNFIYLHTLKELVWRSHTSLVQTAGIRTERRLRIRSGTWRGKRWRRARTWPAWRWAGSWFCWRRCTWTTSATRRKHWLPARWRRPRSSSSVYQNLRMFGAPPVMAEIMCTECLAKLFPLGYLLFCRLLLMQIAKVGSFMKNSGNLLQDRHKNFENWFRNSWDNWGQSCHL